MSIQKSEEVRIKSSTHNNLFLFAHIPKTGGTTLNKIIENNYDSNSIFSFYAQKQPENTNIKDWVSQCNIDRNISKESSNSELIRGHFGLGFHEHLDISSCTYITFLRNPVDRVISNYYYNFFRPDKKVKKNFKTLESFVTSERHIVLDNYQTRFLSGIGWQKSFYLDYLYDSNYEVAYGKCTEEMLETAKRNLDNYVIFGLQDRFSESLNLFKEALGLENLESGGQRNVNYSKPKRDAIEPNIIQIIEEENKFDRELYEYAAKTFDSQLENLQLSPKIVDTKISWSYPSLPKNNNKKQDNRSSEMTAKVEKKVQLSDASKQQLSEGDNFFEAADYSQAINKYKEVIKDNPEYIAALNKLAACCLKIDADDQAIAVFKRILEISPDRQMAHAKLARLLAKKGSNQEAITEYKSAIKLESEQPDWVFIGLGKALQKLKKEQSA